MGRVSSLSALYKIYCTTRAQDTESGTTPLLEANKGLQTNPSKTRTN